MLYDIIFLFLRKSSHMNSSFCPFQLLLGSPRAIKRVGKIRLVILNFYKIPLPCRYVCWFSLMFLDLSRYLFNLLLIVLSSTFPKVGKSVIGLGVPSFFGIHSKTALFHTSGKICCFQHSLHIPVSFCPSTSKIADISSFGCHHM